MSMWREFVRIVKGTFTPHANVDSPRVERAAEQRANQAALEKRQRRDDNESGLA